MKGFLDLAYRLPYVKHYRTFDAGFYIDFPKQLKQMGRWLRDHDCRITLDIGAMTGGCIEHISGLGIRMDGVQFTEDIRRLAAANLRKAGISSTLFVSPVHAPLRLATRRLYDGAVSLGWLNLPHPELSFRRTLATVRNHLNPDGVFLVDFFRFEELVVAPMKSEPGLAFDFAMAMGVRYGEPAWKQQVEALLVKHRSEIQAILRDYGVPLLDTAASAPQ